ncbi:MAG: hypothetical protein IKJ18_00690 [Bacteroidaceae bacterium]|nr:hypothetical protein [Bacteroidaceae bacterium]
MDRLLLQPNVAMGVQLTQSGAWSRESFDMFLAEVVRKEIGKQLGIIRGKAVKKAQAAGAGSASTAVLRRTYKKEFVGAVHILGNRGRISSKRRVVEEPTGGISGHRRVRTVSKRTKKLREYYGPDRYFILKFLEGGTDIRYARSQGPKGRGSMATYGNRGSLAPRSFFHTMSADMEQAAHQLGQTLVGYVEKMLEKEYTEG